MDKYEEYVKFSQVIDNVYNYYILHRKEINEFIKNDKVELMDKMEAEEFYTKLATTILLFIK